MMPLIGIFAELIFGLLSGVGKLYDLIRPKKKKRLDNSSENGDDNNVGCGMRMFGSRKSSSSQEREEEDLELGGSEEIAEEDVVAELMRKHHLCGPPRFLFTIVEETVEDLAADDVKKSRSKLRDLMRADDDARVLSPVASPIVKPLGGKSLDCNGDFNAAFMSYYSQQRKSFKFLRDPEEKVRRKSGEDGGGGQHVQVHCRSCSAEVLDVGLRVEVVSG